MTVKAESLLEALREIGPTAFGSQESHARFTEILDQAEGSPGGGDTDATEAAQVRAAELEVDLASVTGTGSGGRVTVADVEEAAGR